MWSPSTVIFSSHQNSPSSPFEVFCLWSLTYWCFSFQTVYFTDWVNVKKNALVCDFYSHTASLSVPRGGAFPHIRPLCYTSRGSYNLTQSWHQPPETDSQDKGPVPQDWHPPSYCCPHTHFRCSGKSRLSSVPWNWWFPWPLFGLNCWSGSQNSGKHFTYWVTSLSLKRYNPGTARWKTCTE